MYRFILTLGIIFLISCSVKHKYQIRFVDENDNLLDSVKVTSEITSGYSIDSKKEYFIPENNDYYLEFEVNKEEVDKHDKYYSQVNFNISKPGYYDKSSMLNSFYKSEIENTHQKSSEEEVTFETIKLYPIIHKFKVNIINDKNFNLLAKYKIQNHQIKLEDKEMSKNNINSYIVFDSLRAYPIYNKELNKYTYSSTLKLWISSEGYKPSIIELENTFDSDPKNYWKSSVEASIKLEEYSHKFIFNISDDRYNPLNKVRVNFSKENIDYLSDHEEITSENIYETSINPQFVDWSINKLKTVTKVKVRFSKFGYSSVDTIISSDINDDLNNNGIFKININLQKKSEDYIKKYKWDKYYKGVYFEYIPSYDKFIESIDKLMTFIEPNNDKINREQYLFKVLKNEEDDVIYNLYRDINSEKITTEFINDVVELFPEYKILLKNQINDYLLKNDTTKDISREIVLAYHNTFKNEAEGSYYLSLMSEQVPIYFFEGVITDNFFNDIDLIEKYWKEFRFELLIDANSKIYNNKHITAKLVELYLEKEMYDEAIPLISNLMKNFPDYSYTYYYKSQIYLDKELYKYFVDKSNYDYFNNYDLIIEFLTEALKNSNDQILDKSIVTIFKDISEICLNNKKENIVVEVYDEFKNKIKNTFNNNDLNIILTACYYNLEDYKNATFYANEILKTDKNNFKAYLFLGDIELKKKNYKKAIEFFDKVYKIDSTNYNAIYNKAVSHYNSNDCIGLNKFFDEIDILNNSSFEYEDWYSLNELRKDSDKKCNPKKLVTGDIKTYYYCIENNRYEEDCIYLVDIEFTNKSIKYIKKVLIEIEITYNNKTYYKHRGWLNIELIPDSVLEYKVKLKNKVKIWNVHAKNFNKYVRVLDVK